MTTRDRARRQWRALEALSGHFLDVVRGLPTLVAHRRAEAQVDTIRSVTHRHRRATIDTLRVAFASSSVLELVATLSVALVAVTVGLRLASGSVDFQVALTVLLLAPEAYWPLRRVGAEFHAAAEGTAALAEADELLARASTDLPGSTHPGSVRLALSQLGIGYEPGSPLTRPLDLDLPERGLVAIAGTSGCGKSTLLATLRGELPPILGDVLVGGTPLRDVDPDGGVPRWPGQPQRPWLVADTIAANVRIGTPAADDDEVWDALDGSGWPRSCGACRKAWARLSARTAPACRPDSVPVSPWPASCSLLARSCSSTSPAPTSTTRPNRSCSTPSRRSPAPAWCWWWPTARRCLLRRTGSWTWCRRPPPVAAHDSRAACGRSCAATSAGPVPVVRPGTTRPAALGPAHGHSSRRPLHRVRRRAHRDRRLAHHPCQRAAAGALPDGRDRRRPPLRARPPGAPPRRARCSATTSSSASWPSAGPGSSPTSSRWSPVASARAAATCSPVSSTTSTPCSTTGCGCASPWRPLRSSACGAALVTALLHPAAGAVVLVVSAAGGDRVRACPPRRRCRGAAPRRAPRALGTSVEEVAHGLRELEQWGATDRALEAVRWSRSPRRCRTPLRPRRRRRDRTHLRGSRAGRDRRGRPRDPRLGLPRPPGPPPAGPARPRGCHRRARRRGCPVRARPGRT